MKSFHKTHCTTARAMHVHISQAVRTLVQKLTVVGDATWSSRLSMGPLPVAAYWAAKPTKATIARRPLRSSFHLYFSVCSGEPRLKEAKERGKHKWE